MDSKFFLLFERKPTKRNVSNFTKTLLTFLENGNPQVKKNIENLHLPLLGWGMINYWRTRTILELFVWATLSKSNFLWKRKLFATLKMMSKLYPFFCFCQIGVMSDETRHPRKKCPRGTSTWKGGFGKEDCIERSVITFPSSRLRVKIWLVDRLQLNFFLFLQQTSCRNWVHKFWPVVFGRFLSVYLCTRRKNLQVL